MSTVRILTQDLVGLLTSLIPTASTDAETGAIAGVLLHTARGDRMFEPGRTDLLVGTSCNGRVAGHTNADAFGQLHEPMLWPIDDVRTVIAAFKPKAKAERSHAVEIAIDGPTFVVREVDDALFGADGLSVRFSPGRIADYPRGVWSVLAEPAGTFSDHAGRPVLPHPRTDVPPSALAPFARVAAALKDDVELFRYHQRRHLLVQIGLRYRGAIWPSIWDVDQPRQPTAPDVEIHDPGLPPDPPADEPTDE